MFRPSRFQGAHRHRSYFEGYYFKVVDPVTDVALALIPGISWDEHGVGHAFIQVIDGVAGRATYERYRVGEFESGKWKVSRSGVDESGSRGLQLGSRRVPSVRVELDEAAFAKTSFAFAIGPNRFSDSGMSVDLPGLRADFGFRQNVPWPSKPWSPGAMGPFSFVPGMQCKHGVVSLHHKVTGTLQLGGQTPIILSPQAVGYIEKDWGSSFPLRWTWLQTNHLDGETDPCCLLVSAGVVPWVTGAFDGHIAAILLRGQLKIFATYNGSRFQQTEAGDDIQLSFLKPRPADSPWLQLETARPRGHGVDLVAPIASGGMAGKVNESLTASARVRYGRGKQLLLDTTTHYTGFELGGRQDL